MHGVASWHSRLGTSVLCLHQAETGVVRHSSLDLSPRAREHDEPPVDYGHKRKLCLYSAPEHAVVAWPISAPGSTACPPSSSLAHPINPIRTGKSQCDMSLGTYSAAPVVTRKEHLRHSRLLLRDVLQYKVPAQGTQAPALVSVSRLANNAARPDPSRAGWRVGRLAEGQH